jgi:hypothetical protein
MKTRNVHCNIQANSNLEALKLNPIINMHLHVQTIFGSGSNSLQNFILKTSTITSEKRDFFLMKKKCCRILKTIEV